MKNSKRDPFPPFGSLRFNALVKFIFTVINKSLTPSLMRIV
jgi:hypothetical protein